MKIAAAEALAMLGARGRIEEPRGAGAGRAARCASGPNTSSPTAFDGALFSRVSPAVARAAMESGVARRPIIDLQRYARRPCQPGRCDGGALEAIAESVRSNPKAP